MCYPSLKEFIRLSRQGNVIPVYKEINADFDTPVSAFMKIRKDDYAFLFESVEGQEKIARYSFLGSNPCLVIKSKGRNIEIRDARRKVCRFKSDVTPIDEIKKIMRPFRTVNVKGLPRFYGGLVGYIGYDMVRFFEKIPDKNQDSLNLQDSVFMLTDTILIFDRVKHSIKIVNNVILPEKAISRSQKAALYRAAIKKIGAIQENFDRGLPQKKRKEAAHIPDIQSNITKNKFKKMVLAAQKYIHSGDIIQVVLSQRFKIKISRDPFDIYRSLRILNPSPYMFYLKLGDTSLVGSSPEMLLRCEGGAVETRPIAGTRPRGKNQAEDRRLEKELLGDAKEKAEHIMLVDLGRNDLGRVCKPGKVKVSGFMKVERYSHVMHIVSEVKGILDKKYDAYDVLRAGFPAGTVTGSPKIRAMEIIDELENTRRGPYAGCVGYFGFSHNMDTCITIRTIVIKNNTAYIQAGAGIVADSVPEKEYQETINKAKALVEAIAK